MYGNRSQANKIYNMSINKNSKMAGYCNIIREGIEMYLADQIDMVGLLCIWFAVQTEINIDTSIFMEDARELKDMYDRAQITRGNKDYKNVHNYIFGNWEA